MDKRYIVVNGKKCYYSSETENLNYLLNLLESKDAVEASEKVLLIQKQIEEAEKKGRDLCEQYGSLLQELNEFRKITVLSEEGKFKLSEYVESLKKENKGQIERIARLESALRISIKWFDPDYEPQTGELADVKEALEKIK